MQAIIADMPVVVSFGGKDVQGCKSVLRADELAAAAGELDGYQLSVYIVSADWAAVPVVTAPEVGELVSVDGVNYRVLRVYSDIVGTRYDLGEKYTGRT